MMSSPVNNAGRRHALVIGIDQYPFMNAHPVRGCVNDARLMRRVMEESFGFAPSQIRFLRDEEATREAILKELASLLATVGEDDQVLVHFSGHGSQVRWENGFAESIVPHDSGRHGHANLDIVDLEIAGWLAAVARRTPFITLIIDACHAGSIARSTSGVRLAEPDLRPPEEQRRPPLAPWMATATRGRDHQPGPSGWLAPSEHYVLVASCKADERACELDVPPTEVCHGALSFFLASELRRARQDATWREVCEQTAIRVTAHFPHQHPQLEGAIDRQILGRREVKPMRFVPITHRHERRVELAAGAVHGVVPGSRWEVFAPGARSTDRDGNLGHITARKVGAVDTVAEVAGENQAIVAGCRAVEVERPWHAPRLRVRVIGSEEETAQLAEDLRTSALLHLASPTEPWDATLRQMQPDEQEKASWPALQGRSSRPVWIATDPAEQLLMSPRLANARAVNEPIRRHLESWARYRALVELRQHDLDDPLCDTIELELFHDRGTAGPWRKPDAASGGQALFHEGDRLAIRLRHHHERPLHIAVLNLGLSGAVHLLHPIRGARDPLQPGQLLELGRHGHDRIEVFIPEAFPFTGGAFAEGQEILKVIASEEEADFGQLSQEGIRSGPVPPPTNDTLLARLLSMALTGQPERTVERPAQAGKQWTACERGFLVRRPARLDRRSSAC